ncbi:hypothetical protein FQA39_LY02796 [Lamprigera yunnana]|nr:hypothetical protein FQA39_LY02796 [Lamprigera yunnana]
MDQSMEKIQRQFLTIQERINEKREKKYVKVYSKIEEIQEQADNNSGEINGICERLREQGTKLINVEAKVIKKQIRNQYDQAMEDAIIREAMRGETETWYRTKVGEYRNFRQFWNGFMRNYWKTKEESVIKSELYGTKFSHSLRQLEEELLNKVRITEVKKFDEVVRILETHYQCGKDGVRNDGNEYYNHYNNYEQRKYNHSSYVRNNHNYSQGPYQGNQFYRYNKNGNNRSCGRNLNINKIIQ